MRTLKSEGKQYSNRLLGPHDSTNENGLRLIDFAAGRQMTIKSTYFMHKRIHLETWHSPDGRTYNQIDHCLIDGRHFSDVIDAKARRGANIDSDHMLVVIKLRYRISRANNTTPETFRSRASERRERSNNDCHELDPELSGASEPEPLSLNDKWRRLDICLTSFFLKTMKRIENFRYTSHNMRITEVSHVSQHCTNLLT
jgi:hypothetical protein